MALCQQREALAARKEEAVKLVKMGRWRLLALDDDFDGWVQKREMDRLKYLRSPYWEVCRVYVVSR